jgi:hypothetical protein
VPSRYSTLQGVTNGSALFNRRAYVGFSGSVGSLKLGKNLFISNDVWFLGPAGQQFMGTATLVRGRNWLGADNVIEYQTPIWSGFKRPCRPVSSSPVPSPICAGTASPSFIPTRPWNCAEFTPRCAMRTAATRIFSR